MGQDTNIENTANYQSISFKDNQIIHRALKIDKCIEKEKQYCNGKITEQKIGQNLQKEEEHIATWKNEEREGIPNKEIITSKYVYGKGEWNEFTEEFENYDKNFAIDSNWTFVLNGKTQGEKLQSEIKEVTKESNIFINSVRNFFDRFRDKEKENSR